LHHIRFTLDPTETDQRHTASASQPGHTAFVNRLAELAAGFDGPVLLVSGDSHDLRVDPGVAWFTLYGATPQPNVTQIIVDRSIEDDADWLRLHVDPRAPGVFSWEQEFVPSGRQSRSALPGRSP